MSTELERRNRDIKECNEHVFSSLSRRGKRISFNSKGIFAQGADGAKYGDLCNATLGQAMEDDEIMYLDAAYDCFNKDKVKQKDLFPYASAPGMLELREAWRKWQVLNGLPEEVKTSLPIVTNAITNGLYTAGLLFLDEDDVVLTTDRCWGNYKTNIGAKLEFFELYDESHSHFNMKALEKKLNGYIEKKLKKVVLTLNFPNNPTGYSLTEEEAVELTELLKRIASKGLNLIILFDDAYSGFFYEDNVYKKPLFGMMAEAHERILAVKLDGATKNLFMWGFRIGFITYGIKNGTTKFYKALENKTTGILRSSLSNVSRAMQTVVLKTLENQEELQNVVRQKAMLMKKKFQLMEKEVYRHDYGRLWDVYKANSGYFIILRVKGVDAAELREYLLKIYRIGVISTNSTDIRINFASIRLELILTTIHKIAMAIEDIMLCPELDMSVLGALGNEYVNKAVKHAVQICKPKKVRFFQDDDQSRKIIADLSIENGEEKKLEMEGHTIHYDSYLDQARDKKNTKVLTKEPKKGIVNYEQKRSGILEMVSKMRGIMSGKTMIVRFYCLGPTNSKFSKCALQMTDSAYVVHSEDILYRLGFNEFKRLNGSDDFFTFIHSAGSLDKDNVTTEASIYNRRIYIDPDEQIVYSINNQYAGNSLACKKLALRLAIVVAHREGWLAEHVFISRFSPEGSSRKTYFCGAFPSACGKTSTSMLEGGKIVGDDISYLREVDGEVRGVNIEKGVFGIIKNLCEKDDPVIYKALNTPREMIYSNVMINGGKPYWEGMGLKDEDIPKSGVNYAQGRYSCCRRRENNEWVKGDVMDWGDVVEPVPISHPNSRFTISIEELKNKDEALHDPEGVKISGVLYGGRDYDAAVPVVECFDWNAGVFAGATIESVTTSASLDKSGTKRVDVMSIIDFLIIPVTDFLKGHYNFGSKLKSPPKVYAVNYFLQEYDADTMSTEVFKFLATKSEKRMWVLWAEGRVNGEYQDAILTPLGYIPKFEHLSGLFNQYLPDIKFDKEYYNKLFTFRCGRYLEKFERIQKFYRNMEELTGEKMPELFWSEFSRGYSELKQLLAKNNNDCQITPDRMQSLYPLQ